MKNSPQQNSIDTIIDLIESEEADPAEIAENPEDIFLRKIKERQYMRLKEEIFEALYAKSQSPEPEPMLSVNYLHCINLIF